MTLGTPHQGRYWSSTNTEAGPVDLTDEDRLDIEHMVNVVTALPCKLHDDCRKNRDLGRACMDGQKDLWRERFSEPTLVQTMRQARYYTQTLEWQARGELYGDWLRQGRRYHALLGQIAEISANPADTDIMVDLATTIMAAVPSKKTEG